MPRVVSDRAVGDAAVGEEREGMGPTGTTPLGRGCVERTGFGGTLRHTLQPIISSGGRSCRS